MLGRWMFHIHDFIKSFELLRGGKNRNDQSSRQTHVSSRLSSQIQSRFSHWQGSHSLFIHSFILKFFVFVVFLIINNDKISIPDRFIFHLGYFEQFWDLELVENILWVQLSQQKGQLHKQEVDKWQWFFQCRVGVICWLHSLFCFSLGLVFQLIWCGDLHLDLVLFQVGSSSSTTHSTFVSIYIHTLFFFFFDNVRVKRIWCLILKHWQQPIIDWNFTNHNISKRLMALFLKEWYGKSFGR